MAAAGPTAVAVETRVASVAAQIKKLLRSLWHWVVPTHPKLGLWTKRLDYFSKVAQLLALVLGLVFVTFHHDLIENKLKDLELYDAEQHHYEGTQTVQIRRLAKSHDKYVVHYELKIKNLGGAPFAVSGFCFTEMSAPIAPFHQAGFEQRFVNYPDVKGETVWESGTAETYVSCEDAAHRATNLPTLGKTAYAAMLAAVSPTTCGPTGFFQRGDDADYDATFVVSCKEPRCLYFGCLAYIDRGEVPANDLSYDMIKCLPYDAEKGGE